MKPFTIDTFKLFLREVLNTLLINTILFFPFLYLGFNTWSVVTYHKELQKRGIVLPTIGYIPELQHKLTARGGERPFPLLIEYKGELDTVFVNANNFGYYREESYYSGEPRTQSVNVVFLEENPKRVIFEKDILHPGEFMFDYQSPFPINKSLWRKSLWVTFLVINVFVMIWLTLKRKIRKEEKLELVSLDEFLKQPNN